MKKTLALMSLLLLLLLMAVPVSAVTDDLATGEEPPTESPTSEPTTAPGGETEPPTSEPTTEPTVEDREPTQQQELADTGIDSAMLAVAAGGLLLAGGVALLISRRTGKAGR